MSQFDSLDRLQAELVAADADTPIRILGINGIGYESGNAGAVSGRDIPLLQDETRTDVWAAWDVTYRDVVILDRLNRPIGVFNLTEHDLNVPDEYAALRQMLLDAAALD